MAVAWGAWEQDYNFLVTRRDKGCTINGNILSTGTVDTINTNEDTAAYSSSGNLQIDDESFTYTGKTTNSFTGCTRAKWWTCPAAHTSGATVYQMTADNRDNAFSGIGKKYFDDNAEVGDCCYYLTPVSNHSWSLMKGLRFRVATPRDGTVTTVWEYPYYTSATDYGWKAMPSLTDNTAGFSKQEGLVSAITFTGTGLNDGTSGGTYTSDYGVDGHGGQDDFRVQIDGTGTPDTFKWSNDGGATWEATTVAITGSAQTLENGVTITFAATTGHTSGDRWDFTANPVYEDVYWNNESAAADSPSAVTDYGMYGAIIGYSGRYMRCRITAVSGITEGGTQSAYAHVQNDRDAIFISDGSLSVPNEAADIYTADVAGGWNIFVRKGSSYYTYELRRPIIINTSAFLRFKDCHIQCYSGYTTSNLEFIKGPGTLVMGTLNATGQTANAASLNGDYGHLIVSLSSWKMYGGYFRSGPWISSLPDTCLDTSSYDVAYQDSSAAQLIRNYNIYRGSDSGFFGSCIWSGVMSGLKTYNCGAGIKLYGGNDSDVGYIYDWEDYNSGHPIVCEQIFGNTTHYFRDCVFTHVYRSWGGTAGKKRLIYIQYSYAATVVDANGNRINGASVKIDDSAGTNIGTYTTGLVNTGNDILSAYVHTATTESVSLTEQPTMPSNIDITISNYATTNSLYAYIQITGTDAQNIALQEYVYLYGNGTYTTKSKFKTVNANGVYIPQYWTGTIRMHMDGKIYPQYLNKRVYDVRGDDANYIIAGRYTDYTPHTITISKSGYQTKVVKLTADRKTDDVVALELEVPIFIGKGKAFVNTNPSSNQNNILA